MNVRFLLTAIREILIAGVAIDVGLLSGMTLSNLFLPHVAAAFLLVLSIPSILKRLRPADTDLFRAMLMSTPLACSVLVALVMKLGHPWTPGFMLLFMSSVTYLAASSMCGDRSGSRQPVMAAITVAATYQL